MYAKVFHATRQLLKVFLPRSIVHAYSQASERRDADGWLRQQRIRWSKERPVTLNEKIHYKMALDRRPILKVFADKVAVRDYVAARVGRQVLNEVYQVVEDPADIDMDALPERFVVKPSHGSAAIIFVHDEVEPNAHIPSIPKGFGWPREQLWVSRKHLDRARFNTLCRHWLSCTYCPYEWAYRGLERRLIVERFLEGPGGSLPTDYKIRVFHGKVRWLYAHQHMTPDHGLTLHWPDWTLIPAHGDYPRPPIIPEKPASLDKMIAISEALGAETDKIRVDLYDVGGEVIFGELTNYPNGGTVVFEPPEYNTLLGEGWEPPREYR